MQARPLMSIDEMRNVAKSRPEECPGEALHEADGEKWVAFDDVTGQRLDPGLMRKARMDEIAYFREMGVYEKVDLQECWEVTGKAPIAVRWVDINKGDSESPNYRSRLVAKEFNTGVCPELYAATPPSECLRLMLSLLASTRKQGAGLMYADVSRAYFYAKAKRPVYVKLPEEDLEEGDEHRCGRLLMSMYGTRDAALNWSLEYSETLAAAGYDQGKGNSCLFHNAKLGVSVMVHGDDFIGVGPEEHLKELRKTLEEKYKLKVEMLGRKGEEKKEIKILNKIVRETEDGIELEADPRHVEIAIRELGIAECKPAATPGIKEVAKSDADGAKIKQSEIRRNVQKDIDEAKMKNEETIDAAAMSERDDEIDAIATAKESMGENSDWQDSDINGEWNNDEDGPKDDDDPELGPEEARLYRGVAARFNYIAPDRADIAFAVKEAARSMSAPRESDLKKLRRLGKYLLGKPRLIMRFQWQDPTSTITAFTDSDWAGCQKSAKSTSGGALCIGEHVIKTYSKQQKTVALSSAEAELYAMVAASAEALGLQAYARDLGMEMACEMFCDSSAALGISQRAGIGKVRHLRTQGLWVQEVRVSGRIAYKKVLGEKNPADLMTKHMGVDLAQRHLETLNMKMIGGRSEAAPTIDSIVHGWFVDTDGNACDSNVERKKTRFLEIVELHYIPAIGMGRRTPTRGSSRRRLETASGRADAPYGWETQTRNAATSTVMNIDEEISVKVHEGQEETAREASMEKVHEDDGDGNREQDDVGHSDCLMIRGDGQSWADQEPGEQICASRWWGLRPSTVNRGIDAIDIENPDRIEGEVECGRKARMLVNEVAQSRIESRRGGGGFGPGSRAHLCGVEMHRRLNSTTAPPDFVQSESAFLVRGAPKEEREVLMSGDVARWSGVHARVGTQRACTCIESCVCALPCFRMRTTEHRRISFPMRLGSSPLRIQVSKLSLCVRSRVCTCYSLRVVAERRLKDLRSSRRGLRNP